MKGIRFKKLKTLLNFAFVYSITQSANASLLTLELEAVESFTDNSVYESGLGYTSEEIVTTPVSSEIFQVKYTLDYTPIITYTGNEIYPGRYSEYDYDGLHRSSYLAQFLAQGLIVNSPFSGDLLANMPTLNSDSYLVSEPNSSFYFISRVVSDNDTGDIVREKSYEYFNVGTSYSVYDNDNDIYYGYSLNAYLFLPTNFLSAKANYYDLSELKGLLNQEGITVRYSEIFHKEERTDSGHDLYAEGYRGVGTFIVEVPEPTSLTLVVLALLGLICCHRRSCILYSK